jgi:two-component system OmpR family sensor kinase
MTTMLPDEATDARAPIRRMLATLEQLLAVDVADLESALTQSCDLVAEALSADKVDAFLYQPSKDTLVALSTSQQALSALQKKLGLDVLPISNGGRAVSVYQTGETFVTGALDEDAGELKGIRQALAIRSEIGVALKVNGKPRGMMMIASQQKDFFSSEDVAFAEAIVRWVAIVAHKAELAQEIARSAVAEGRRAAADELITVLAHDLRNFVAPIGARLNLLRLRARQERRECDERDAEAATGSLMRLSRLISDLLDVSRLDQGVLSLDVQPIELSSIVGEVGTTLATPEHAVTIDCTEHAVVLADASRLRQCLENLVSNAIRYSPPEAPVTVSIGRHKSEQGEWGRAEIRDQGPGISADLLPRIFERFTSGPNSPGLGLGLYLARRITLAHGGELSVDSAPGKGARFTLLLPLSSER